MDSKEFKVLTDGISYAKLAEITGKSVACIQAYASDNSPIPYEIALIAQRVGRFFEGLKPEKDDEGKQRKLRVVINRKLFDTLTSSMIASRDFSFDGREGYSEELYRTRKGVYFLVTDMNPHPPHYVHDDEIREMRGGTLIPLDPDEAKEWLEEHSNATRYIAAFGKPEEA